MEVLKKSSNKSTYSTEPVVRAKPEKARGMGKTVMIPKRKKSSETFPVDLAHSKTNRNDPPEMYYQGNVNGDLFFVPDRNLEAMKDTINLKMRTKTSLRYKNETQFDNLKYNYFNRRLGSILDKVKGSMRSESSIASVGMRANISYRKSYEWETIDKRSDKQILKESGNGDENVDGKLMRTEKSNENETFHTVKYSKFKDESQKPLKEYSPYDENSTLSISAMHPDNGNLIKDPLKKSGNYETINPLKPPILTHGNTDTSKISSRFLISGHLKMNKTPIFIIQEYKGQLDILKHQLNYYESSFKEENVSVSISGKLFKENILFEKDGGSQYLSIDPRNVMIIDPEKSKIFTECLEETLYINGIEILLRGKFLENKLKRQFTPLLSFKIVRQNVGFTGVHKKETRKASSSLVLYKPLHSRDTQECIDPIRFRSQSHSSSKASSSSVLYKPLHSRDTQECIDPIRLRSQSHSSSKAKEECSLKKWSTRASDTMSQYSQKDIKAHHNTVLKDHAVKKYSNTEEEASNTVQKLYKQISLMQNIFRDNSV